MDAKPQAPTFYGVTQACEWTHINLISGRKGKCAWVDEGGVVMQDETGRQEIFESGRLHLTWAPLNSEQQGEQA